MRIQDRDTLNGKLGEEEIRRRRVWNGKGAGDRAEDMMRSGWKQTVTVQGRCRAGADLCGEIEAEMPRRLASSHGQAGRPSLCW